MNLFLIGQLLEVKPIEQTDKKTDRVKYSTDLTVLFQGFDEEGYKKISAETINVDEEYYKELKPHIGKYVAIAYHSETNQWGTRTYPDRSMPVMTMDKSPFDFSEFERKESKVSKDK